MADDPKSWYRDGYMISTAPQLIQVDAVNEAMASDEMYWAKRMDRERLKKMLDKSLCFGVYELPEGSSGIAGRSGPPQVGFARLITDEVSFAYLTDVYVLPSHQGKGLGKWLLDCVDAELASWPDLRRSLFMANEGAKEFYRKTIAHTPFEQGKAGMYLLNKKWAGAGMDV